MNPVPTDLVFVGLVLFTIAALVEWLTRYPGPRGRG